MYRAVVELHPLADPDGTAAQHHDLFFLVLFGLVLPPVGGVEIGAHCLKLRRTSIYQLVRRLNAILFAQGAHFTFAGADKAGDGAVGKAHLLHLEQRLLIQSLKVHGFELLLQLNDVLEFIEEEQVDFGELVNFLDAHAPANGLGDEEQPLVVLLHDII